MVSLYPSHKKTAIAIPSKEFLSQDTVPTMYTIRENNKKFELEFYIKEIYLRIQTLTTDSKGI